MARERVWGLMIAGLGVLALLTVVSLWGASRAHTAPRDPQWAAWSALSRDARVALRKLNDEVQSRENPRAVLAAARRFAQLPPDVQAHYRRLHAVVREVTQAQAAPARRALLNLPPQGRAVQVLKWLESDHPEKLGELLRQQQETK